ncbi:MAG: SRPBCC family protein [Deltaproteobacteria bacterium]|jgi:carbon monoxide dehydrogenase subunit G|nr:SRPBCC family protein [Deltaproteobacteria bacterium]
MQVSVSVFIDAPPSDVWADVADLESHGEWMQDAEAVEIVGELRRGAGTVMRVPTRVGPLATEDWIIVTDWIEGERIGVVHVGLVTGAGAITVEPEGDGTRVRWEEQLDLPITLGGPIGEIVAKPILAALWSGNLRRLASRLA